MATAVLALAPFGTACGTGQVAQTAEHVATSPVERAGEITVPDVEFLFAPPVVGDEVYRVGQTAPLSASIVNEGRTADRLVQITSPLAAGVLVPAEVLPIPGGRTVTTGQVGPLSAIEAPTEVEIGPVALTGLLAPIRSGISYPVVFQFERAGAVVVDVPVATPEIPRLPAWESD